MFDTVAMPPKKPLAACPNCQIFADTTEPTKFLGRNCSIAESKAPHMPPWFTLCLPRHVAQFVGMVLADTLEAFVDIPVNSRID